MRNKDFGLHSPEAWLRLIAQTSMINISTAAVAAVAGILVSRGLGPAQRGEYAAVIAWFGVAQVVFDVGLSIATVRAVARRQGTPLQVAARVATLSVPLGCIGALVIVTSSRWLTGYGSDMRVAALIAGFSLVAGAMGAPPVFALQGYRIVLWNAARFLQPASYLIIIVYMVFVASASLTVTAVLTAFLISIVMQAALAWGILLSHNRLSLRAPASCPKVPDRRSLLGYGCRVMVGALPGSLNARIDQIVLAAAVSSMELGNYAIAASFSLLIAPILSAVGSVLFPKVAAQRITGAQVSQFLKGSALVATLGVGGLVLLSPFAIPTLYGTAFQGSIPLVAILGPSAVAVMLSGIASDMLRGMGRVREIAICQWSGAALSAVILMVAVPRYGAIAAAATSSIVNSTVAAVLIWNAIHFAVRRQMPARPTAEAEDRRSPREDRPRITSTYGTEEKR